MSLYSYNNISANNNLGINLPKLTAGELIIKNTERSDRKKTADRIAQFKAELGWIMYRDRLELTPQSPSSFDFIEAQYCKDNSSLHIKLIDNNRYQINEFTSSSSQSGDSNQVYSQQSLLIRNNLKEQALKAKYRLWWQRETDGDNAYRWQPLLQQFIGFEINTQQGEA